MSALAPQSYDLVIAGGGIVGTACALACTEAGLRVALAERELLGSGSTRAGMGHIVVMDNSEAQFALTRRSQQLWHELSASLPAQAEFSNCGTVWVASDDEELAEAAHRDRYLKERAVPSRLLSGKELADLEPNLRPGLAGGLLAPEDAIVFPPAAALWMAQQAQAQGARGTWRSRIAIPASSTINWSNLVT